jgi:4-alpha-glucanotransferase
MPPRISLSLAIHNHQPVGNFGWVIAEVYQRAYLPMLEALERHPHIQLALHYSGPLLEWVRAEQPAFIDRLRALVERGQVELLGGGWFEPILASLPERDRITQLRRMADEMEDMFGRQPAGAWLAERVWEPDLPTSLANAGYRWTILDDAHFRAASIPEDDLWGTYTTEDQGHLLTVFGTEQGLRYRIPFGEVDDVIRYLREHATEAGDRVGMMGDDGEKFGGWPTTWEHCWGRNQWVERFFAALEDNRDWLSTVTPSAWLDRSAPIGRVYVPTSSYAEMGEWALPADEAPGFAAVVRHAREGERPEARWLRGGFWRNFQVRYREINDLHKQMLRVSAKVAAMAEGPSRTRAVDHLGRGQSNDCYWHGLFGGIYLSDMRLATLGELIAAEDIADRELDTRQVALLADLDLDGRDEVLLADDAQVVVVDLDEGAGIGAWDIRAARHALAGILRRRSEAYHATLRRHEKSGTGGPAVPRAEERDAAVATGAASIHDLVTTKEPGLAQRLHLDPFERRSGLVRFLHPDATPEEWATGQAEELGDAVDGPFLVGELTPGRLVVTRDAVVRSAEGETATVRIQKAIALSGDRLAPRLSVTLEIQNRADQTVEARLGSEWSLTMLGGGGNPAAWWEIGESRTAHDVAGAKGALDRIAQGNDWLGVRLETRVEPAVDAWWAPIETVSNSEAGFERIYQGAGLLLSMPVTLTPGGRWTLAIEHRVDVARDRALEDPVGSVASA